MNKEKKYCATIEIYVWANDEEEAMERAKKIAVECDKEDGSAAVVSIEELKGW